MRNKTNILVVNDVKGMREILAEVLKEKGYHIVLVEDGYKAIKKVKEMPFSIIFMDINMPGINGIETLKGIKKISPKTTVIMMTAYPSQDLVREAIKEGAYTVLSKPFDLEKIINLVEKISS